MALNGMCCKYPIQCYYNRARLRLHAMLKLYAGLSIRQCVYGIEISQNGIYPTQCCMPVGPKDIFAIAKSLNAHQKRIPKATLDAFAAQAAKFKPATAFAHFDEYFDYVASEAERSKVLVNGKCLLVYDYCLRTGYSIGLVPQDFVYLFCGAREGAETVLPKGALAGRFRVPTVGLQTQLGTSMDSMEIEDFLCVCKIPLKYLSIVGATMARPSAGCSASVPASKAPMEASA